MSVRASSSTSTNSSSSAAMSHDCLFCCAFNAFLQQHKCYHKLLSNNSSNTSNHQSPSATAMMEFYRHESRQAKQKTPSPTPSQKWFIHNDITRDEIAKMLNDRPVGAFVVRPSKTCGVGSFVLSVRVPVFVNGNGIAHYLIVKTPENRYRFQGVNEKEWSDIESLIVHHTIMREFLPCTLHMPIEEGCDENDEPPMVPPRASKHDSTSTIFSSSSSWSAASRSSRSLSANNRSRSNDHEVLSDFLRSIHTRSQGSPRPISSRSPSINHQSRPTICA